MKAIMKSVSPRICEKVASGDCTMLVSKTAPKCGAPFKGYIYCTKSICANVLHLYINGGIGRQKFGIIGHWRSGKKVVEVNPHIPAYRYNSYLAEGKVIGEFICDKIIEWQYDKGHQYYVEYPDDCTSYFPYLKCHSEATGLKCSEIEKLGKGKPLYGWHISDLKIYDKPLALDDFYLEKAPKSWRYV